MTVVHNYVSIENRLDDVRDKYAKEEGYIPAGEEFSPWIPFVENVWIRHLKFDTVNNSAVNILKCGAGGTLGIHRHRGPVTGFVLEGSWKYLEYDWIAKPGDYIQENPGRSHTLYSEQGMKTLFHLNGSLEFLDESGNITEISDVFWFIDHYTRYCEENNIPINKKMFL